ncbi:MAG TPA: hypothetical protein VM733_18480 [Thermoanaerobaculia bacterium]|nr:hypothetical protein [Thermoanaerobaculia bacterium]
MRKLIAATTLTAILAAGSATAAPARNTERERTPRDRENPIVRIYNAVKRLITVNELPLPPLP